MAAGGSSVWLKGRVRTRGSGSKVVLGVGLEGGDLVLRLFGKKKPETLDFVGEFGGTSLTSDRELRRKRVASRELEDLLMLPPSTESPLLEPCTGAMMGEGRAAEIEGFMPSPGSGML